MALPGYSFVTGQSPRYSQSCVSWGRVAMSVQWVLLPVFVLVGLTFALLLGMVATRGYAQRGGPAPRNSAGKANWTGRAAQYGDCFHNSFQVPVLFYILIALALPLRHADLVIVLLSWVFVVTRFVHAGIFVNSNDLNRRSLAWFAGVLVWFAMWVYFALKMLLFI